MNPGARAGAGGLLRRLFAIDPRSAAAFRVGIALVILSDVWVRSRSLTEHYTDDGVLPRSLAVGGRPAIQFWSLHALSGSSAWQGVLFSLSAIAALGLLVGLRTRLMTILSWVLLVSVQARNQWVNNSGDTLLRVLLFWSMFVPLGSAWSIDSLRGKRTSEGRPIPILSPASAALLLQLCAMYWITARLKWNDVWLQGRAMDHVVTYADYLKGSGQWLREAPAVRRAVSVATPWFELILPALAFLPVRTAHARLAVVPALFLFHAGIMVTLATGLFQVVAIVGWLLFLPPEFWDTRTVRRVVAGAASPFAGWLRRIAEYLGRPRPAPVWTLRLDVLAQVLVCGLLVGFLVESVRFVSRVQPGVASAPPGIRGFPDRLEQTPRRQIPMGRAGRLARLELNWSMFARPLRTGGYNEVVGVLEDGREIDLLAGGTVVRSSGPPRPAVPSRIYPDQRWRKLFASVSHGAGHELLERLARVLCRRWNTSHPDRRVHSLTIRFVADSPPGELTPPQTLLERVLWRGPCP